MNIQNIVDFSLATTQPERYRPDQAKVLKGDPEQAVYNQYNSPCGQMSRRLGRCDRPMAVNFTEHEYCEIFRAFRAA